MDRHASLIRPGIAGALTLAALAAPAFGAPNGDKYVGETETGEKVKLITNGRDAVVRGAITSITDCDGDFDDFRARVEFKRPLDESSRQGFLDEASIVEEDDRFSGRYKYLIEGERQSDEVFSGEFTLKVTFRRDGEKYTTCKVRDLVFGAELSDV